MPLLFSYGTLQQPNVQLATFGRELPGTSDSLDGYEQSLVAIDDPEVVRTSGKTHHPIVKYTGTAAARVSGTVRRSCWARESDCSRGLTCALWDTYASSSLRPRKPPMLYSGAKGTMTQDGSRVHRPSRTFSTRERHALR